MYQITTLNFFFSKKETLDFEVGKVKFGAIELMNNERNLSSMTSRRARAMANATAFQSMTLNPSFMCKMSPSHIHPGKCLVSKSTTLYFSMKHIFHLFCFWSKLACTKKFCRDASWRGHRHHSSSVRWKILGSSLWFLFGEKNEKEGRIDRWLEEIPFGQ